jgi:PKD repeat protein
MRDRTCPMAEALESRRLFAAFDVLVFSKTAAFRHDSIADGIQMIQELGASADFSVTTTEDATQINAANLAQYEVVVFLSTTGDFLDDAQQTAFEDYIANGGGWVGIHGAAAGEENWGWYQGLLGTSLDDEAPVQDAIVNNVAVPSNPVASGLPSSWEVVDELYNFTSNPRDTPDTDVLLTLDESSYTGGTMGADNPIAWTHPYMGGRAFYIGLGHTADEYVDANFRLAVVRGIQYASGLQPTPDEPFAIATADPDSGTAPLTVHLSSAGSDDRDRNGPLTYAWSFSGEAGVVDSTDPNPTHTFDEVGHYSPRLTVTNEAGLSSIVFVDVEVTAPPDPPPITNPDSATTLRDTAVTIDVLANDTDNQDRIDPRFVQFPAQPAHGTATAAPSGIVTYTPAPGFTGVDTFAYTVFDQEHVSLPATVTVTVNPPPDAPALELTLDDDLPASVLNGQKVKGKIFATVRNFGAQPLDDRVTIDLFASTDGTIDDSDTPLTALTKNLSLAPFTTSKQMTIKVAQPFASADGTYRVLARATSSTTEPSEVIASPSAVKVAPPFRDLAAELAPPIPTTVKTRSRGVIGLLIRNDGNATAVGSVQLFFGDYQPTGPAFLHLTNADRKIKLKPGASKLIKAHVTFNEVVSVHRLTGSITPSEAIGDVNHENDVTETINFTAED